MRNYSNFRSLKIGDWVILKAKQGKIFKIAEVVSTEGELSILAHNMESKDKYSTFHIYYNARLMKITKNSNLDTIRTLYG